MIFSTFWARASSAFLCLPLLVCAQSDLLKVSAQPAAGKRGEPFTARVQVQLKPGLHVNSNKPNDPTLIPLRLTLDKGGFEIVKLDFPAAKNEKYEFSDEPLNVFTGNFTIGVTLKSQPATSGGLAMAGGKLRYQACSETMCYPPKTVDVRIPVDLR